MDDPQDKTVISDQRSHPTLEATEGAAVNNEQDVVSSEQEEVISEQGVQDVEQSARVIEQDAAGDEQMADTAAAAPITPIAPQEPGAGLAEPVAEPAVPISPITPMPPSTPQDAEQPQAEVQPATGVQMVGDDVVSAGAEAAEDAKAANVANAHNESTIKDLVTKVIGLDGNIDPARAIGLEEEIMSQRAEAQKGQVEQ
jgi:hypothetical protein